MNVIRHSEYLDVLFFALFLSMGIAGKAGVLLPDSFQILEYEKKSGGFIGCACS